MEAEITVTGDLVRVTNPPETSGDEVAGLAVMGLDSVEVAGPGDERTDHGDDASPMWECALCHAKLDDDNGESYGDHYGPECPENMDVEEWVTVPNLKATPPDEPNYGPHHPEPVPVSWLNNARIDVDDEKDRVDVAISVGDPRGGFMMRVERFRYEDDDGQQVDELRLSVPTDQDAQPHMELEFIGGSPGFYRIKGGV